MYTKIEFHLYSNYDTSKTVQELSSTASAVYTDLYKCSKSPTKTLGISDYFGNEPQVFNFELDYDDWLKFNIIDESNDISREFSSYVIRVFENDVYTYSGVLMLEYFKVDLARNRLSLKSYNWLIFLNKIKNTFIWFPFFDENKSRKPAYIQYPLQTIQDEENKRIYDLTREFSYSAPEASIFAKDLIKIAQSLVFPNSLELEIPIIKTFASVENILFQKERLSLINPTTYINKQDTEYVGNAEGYIYNEVTEIVYYFFCKTRTRKGVRGRYWYIDYKIWGFNGIVQYEEDHEEEEDRDDDKYLQRYVDRINYFHREKTGTTEILMRRDGSIPKINARTGFESVTDKNGNYYTRTYSERNETGAQNVYWDVICYCDYVTNGASVLWKQSTSSQPERISTADCLKTLCIAANACFVITPDDLDEIKFITKYKNSAKTPIAISDDDLIDDCELSRIAKTEFDSGVLKNTISGKQRLNYQDKLTVYYNQFFKQNNTKIKSTVSRIFNNYNIEITDKIDILDYAQVVNSVQTDDEHFIELESMNYMINNWIDELGNHIIDELGNRISFRSF